MPLQHESGTGHNNFSVSKIVRIPITRPKKALSTNDSTSGSVNELFLTRVPAYLEASNIYDYFEVQQE
jgi:hypothetical protein